MFVDAAGSVQVSTNRQAGQFAVATAIPGTAGVVAATVGDIDADGAIDVVALESKGIVRKASWVNATWTVGEVAAWSGFAGGQAGAGQLLVADLDNNGALDLIASAQSGSHVWLANQSQQLGSAADVA